MRPHIQTTKGISGEFIGQYLQWAEQQWAASEGLGHKFKYIDGVLIEIFNPGNMPGYVRFIEMESGLFAFRNQNMIQNVDEKGSNVFDSEGLPVMVRQYPTLSSLNYNEEWSSSLSGLDIDDYGNVDWKGLNGEILCWKGVNTRHFAVDYKKYIPGYMVFDEEVGLNGDLYYTPFGPNIYSGGSALATIPNGDATQYIDGVLVVDKENNPILTKPGSTDPKVLGCAYTVENFLVSIVSMNYRELENPDKGDGGFYDEVYLNGSRIAYKRGLRPKVNWFFNQSGTEAQCVVDEKVRKITINGLNVTFSEKAACAGSTEELVTSTYDRYDPYTNGHVPAFWFLYNDTSSFSVQGTSKAGSDSSKSIKVMTNKACIVAVDYADNVEIVKHATYTLDDSTKSEQSGYGLVGWLKDIYSDYNPSVTIFYEYECVDVGSTPGVRNGCPPYSFKFSSGSCVPETGEVLTRECGSPGSSAMCSWSVTDGNGNTATSPGYYLKGGSWVSDGPRVLCGGYYPYFFPCSLYGSTYGGTGMGGYAVSYGLADRGEANCSYAGRNQGTVYVPGPTTNTCGIRDLVAESMASCNDLKFIYETQKQKYVCV